MEVFSQCLVGAYKCSFGNEASFLSREIMSDAWQRRESEPNCPLSQELSIRHLLRPYSKHALGLRLSGVSGVCAPWAQTSPRNGSQYRLEWDGLQPVCDQQGPFFSWERKYLRA